MQSDRTATWSLHITFLWTVILCIATRPVYANEECGAADAQVVVCDQAESLSSLTYSGVDASFKTNTLVLDNENLSINLSRSSGVLYATNYTTEVGDLTFWLKNFDEITFEQNAEIRVSNNVSGSAEIRMDAGTLLSPQQEGVSVGGSGLLYAVLERAHIGNGATSLVTVNGGLIDFSLGSTPFRGVSGVVARSYAQNSSSAVVQLNGGGINLDANTRYNSSFPNLRGIETWVRYPNNNGTALASITGGAIDIQVSDTAVETYDTIGAYSLNTANGDSRIELEAGSVDIRYLDGGFDQSTTDKLGLFANIDNSDNSSLSSVYVSGGSVTVVGTGGIGARSLTNGTGSAVFRGSGTGTVSASGLDAIGVQVEATQSSASYEVALSDSASISGGSGNGAAIFTKSVSGSSGSIVVGAGTTVDGSNGQAAVLDGAGNTTVTVAGTLLGAVDLGDGADIVNLRPTGFVSGVVDGGAGEDTLRLGASLDVNNGGNPYTNKYKNFEIFEFVTFSVPVVSNPNVDLSIGVDEIVEMTSDTTVETRALSGSGDIAIASGITMTLEQSADSTFAGQLSGSGNFVKSGAGTLTITGSHGLSGEVDVSEGILVVDGDLSSASLSVGSAGRLQGSGTLGSVNVSGVFAPGNSPGSPPILGDFAINSSGTLDIEIDGSTFNSSGGAGSYDRIVLTNSNAVATLDGTLTPILRGISGDVNNDFTPEYGDTFTIVTTANPNGISGAFDTVSQPTDGMPDNARFDVLYASSSVDLVLTPDSYEQFSAGFSDVANYRNFGRALDTIRPASGANPDTSAQDFFEQLYPLNGSQLTAAMIALTGEVHAFAITDLRDGAHSLSRNSFVGGLNPQSEGRNAWIDVSGTRLTYSQGKIASRYESDLGNIWLGFDLEQRGDLRYGLAFGHVRSELDAGIAGSSDSTLTMLMGYYANRVGDITFGAKLGLGRGTFDTERSTVLADGSHSATASGAATLAFAGFSADYHHELHNGFDGKMWADLSVMYADADSYAESGSSVIAAALQSDTLRSGSLTVGYEVSTQLGSSGADDRSAATFGFGLRHAFGGDRIYSRALTMHGAEWQVSGTDVDPTTAFANLGVTYVVGSRQTVSAAVIGQGNHDYTGVGASLSFVSRF